MNKRLNTVVLVVALATGAVASSQVATAAPSSPGACNMLNVSPTGMDGMGKASERGLGNMMELVAASMAAGCSP
jgi:hypothetical protein